MNIHCYISLQKKKRKKERKRDQQEPNPSLQHGSQALKPLRFSKKVLTKGYINNSLKFETIFSRKWLRVGDYSFALLTLLVEYYTIKNRIEIGDLQFAYSHCQ